MQWARIVLLLTAAFGGAFFFHTELHADMEDSISDSSSLDKAKDLARGDLEFRLPSTDIRSYSLGDFKDFKAVLLVATDSSACANTDFERSLLAVQKKILKSKKLQIVVIDFADKPEREKIATRLKASSLIYLFDSLQMIAPSFRLEKAGDFVLVEPESIDIKERGNLLKAGSLTESLPKEFRTNWSHASSETLCSLKFADVKIDDFKQDFSRPFARACLGCHNVNQVHDIFTTLDKVVGWQAMSLRTVRLMRMPGRYDPYYYPYRSPNERSDLYFEASTEDVRKVVKWITSPPPLTDEMRRSFLATREIYTRPVEKAATELPVLLTVDKKDPIQVPATGAAIYTNAFIGEPLKEDMIVQGIFLRTNLNVVHHTTIFAFDPKTVDGDDFAKSANMSYQIRRSILQKFYGAGALKDIAGSLHGKKVPFTQVFEPLLATFNRRKGTLTFPPDSALTLRKGTQLAIQLHMEPSGKPEEATISFDLLGRVSKQPFSELRRVSVNPDKSFRIKPHQKSYIVTSWAKFDRRILLKSMSIHSHYRGVAGRVRIEKPSGGGEQIIASIPYLQYKMDRRLSFPNGGIAVEAGSRLVSEIEYDNSERNSANPNANAVVGLGGGTIEDEMHYPRYLYIEQ